MAHKDKRSVHTDALETLGTIIGDSEKRDAIHLAVEPVEAGEWLVPGQDISLVNGKAFNRTGKHIGIVDPFIKEPIAPGQKFWLVVYPRMITSLRHVWTHPSFPDVPEVAVEPVPFAELTPDVKRQRIREVLQASGEKLKAEAENKSQEQPVSKTQAVKPKRQRKPRVIVPKELEEAIVAEREAAAKEQAMSDAEKWLREYAEQMDADFDEMMYVAGTHYRSATGQGGYGDYLIDGGKWESECTPEVFWDHYAVFKGVEPLSEHVWKPNFFSCSC